MRSVGIALASALLIASTGASAQSGTVAPSQSAPDQWRGVDEALGRAGTVQPDGVHRYSFPRSDLNVSLDGVAVKPALALGSWLAFQPMGDQTMVMGDLVLTHEEVNPVMSRLLAGGLTVTALHNHLLRSTPATMYMHVSGHGDPIRLATALRSSLSVSHTPMQAPAKGAEGQLALDTVALDRIMGKAGKANGGVYQFGFPRREAVTDHGMAVPASLGTATAINIQPIGGGRAVATGDFVLTASEVDPVLRALRGHGIEVTALHNHMMGETPPLYFMHFWGNDDAQKLATGLRAAVDKTNIAAR
jgi:hypothetical protein